VVVSRDLRALDLRFLPSASGWVGGDDVSRSMVTPGRPCFRHIT
jgi:hypothetical protein